MVISNYLPKITAGSVRVLSELDSTTSLLPMLVKDTAGIAGRNRLAKKEGGEHEAREKFIEEAGTTALWLGGIPFTRFLIDNILLKPFGIDPKIDLKKFTARDGSLQKAEHIKGIKAANIFKTVVSVAIPLYMLMRVLPKFNQDLSRKIILSRAEKEKSCKNDEKNIKKVKPEKSVLLSNKSLFEKFQNKDKTIKALSFTGLGSVFKNIGDVATSIARNAQINPVDSMLPLDLSISGNRVFFVSRNKQEKAEYAIKEGGIIFFFFFASRVIKAGFEKMAKQLGIPVDLDFKVLGSKEFRDKMADARKDPQKFYKELKMFNIDAKKASVKKENAVYNRIIQNFKAGKGSFFTNMAAESGVLKTVQKDSGLIRFIKPWARRLREMAKSGFTPILNESTGKALDTRSYIEMQKVDKLSKNLANFAEQMIKNGDSPDRFIRKTMVFKGLLTFANLAICGLALGYVLPKIQYFIREKVFGSKEYPGIKAYKEEAEKICKSK